MGDLLRHTLKCKQLSHRAVQRRACEILQKQPGQKAQTMGSTIRVKLRKGEEWRLSYEELLLILEAAQIDTTEFFAILAKVGKLSLAVFGPIKTDHWNQDQKKILSKVAKVEERGSRGYLEARAELKSIELLRDDDPVAAEEAAWAFLEKHKHPGALVGALAILAVEAPQANARKLLELAFDLLGPEGNSSAAGLKLVTSMGRSLYVAGLYQEAFDVLDKYALRLASLFGSLDEIALVNYYIGISASRLGDIATCRQSLGQCFAIGSGRWQFAALQWLALLELNAGNVHRAAEMYDELVTLPFFDEAEARARVCVESSRMSALFVAGRLGPWAESEFRRIVEATRSFLDIQSQVAVVLDFALFLRSIGKEEEARSILKAERWNVVDLEDSEIKRSFVEQWESLGIPGPPLVPPTVNPKEANQRPLRPPASRLCLGRIPRLPAEDPKE